MIKRNVLPLVSLVLTSLAWAAESPPPAQSAAVPMPPSAILSDEAKAALARPTEGPGATPLPRTADMAETRRLMNNQLQPNVARMREVYPVDVEESTIDGISVAIVTPKGGVPARNRNRVLLNAPGGGFVTGIRANGLLISIPVASLGGFKVVTMLYRQAPEHRFPAATEDMTRVYKALLKTYKPKNVGLFGCSAGGALVAETVGSLIRNNDPTPGVIGIYCAGLGGRFDGDSASYSAILSGVRGAAAPGTTTMSYFEGMDVNRADITPANDLAILAKFPPTIFLTGTRDFAMSQAAYGHRRLLEAGVQSDLLIFDGLGHGWMTNPNLPETREAQTITTKFYDRYLGR